MNKYKFKSCDLNLGTDEENYDRFVNIISIAIKNTFIDVKNPFFVSQFSKYLYHKKLVNPLYSYPTPVSGKIFDQNCPFCKRAFITGKRSKII